MIHLLFICTEIQRKGDLIVLAKSLLEKSDKLKIFFFENGRGFYEFSSVDIDRSPETGGGRMKTLSRSRLKSLVSLDLSFLHLYREFKYLKNLKKDYVRFSSFFFQTHIDYVFGLGDRHTGLEPVFLKICKELNIPFIIPYLVNYADFERLKRTSGLTKITEKSYYSKSKAKKFFRLSREGYFYYPHYITEALNRFGVLTANTWVMGAGHCSAIAVGSSYEKQQLLSEGVEEAKIHIIGHIKLDELFNVFVNSKNFKTGNKIVISLPQLGEHHILPWDRHWEEINFLVKIACEASPDVVLILHPKMKFSDYSFLTKYGCRIETAEPLKAIVQSDLYVATYSTTIVWAVLCGVKSLVVDFYDLNYSMYDYLQSIEKITVKHLLKEKIKELLLEKKLFNEDWENLSRNIVFRGNNSQLYLELIARFKI